MRRAVAAHSRPRTNHLRHARRRTVAGTCAKRSPGITVTAPLPPHRSRSAAPARRGEPARKRAGALYRRQGGGQLRAGADAQGLREIRIFRSQPDHGLAGHRRQGACGLHRAGAPEVAARGRADRDDEAATSDKGAPAPRWCSGSTAARSLDVQHNARQIIERINAYFGYAAVGELRIVQAPVGRREPSRGAEPRPVGEPADARGLPHRRSGLAGCPGQARRGRQSGPLTATTPQLCLSIDCNTGASLTPICLIRARTYVISTICRRRHAPQALHAKQNEE